MYFDYRSEESITEDTLSRYHYKKLNTLTAGFTLLR